MIQGDFRFSADIGPNLIVIDMKQLVMKHRAQGARLGRSEKLQVEHEGEAAGNGTCLPSEVTERWEEKYLEIAAIKVGMGSFKVADMVLQQSLQRDVVRKSSKTRHLRFELGDIASARRQ